MIVSKFAEIARKYRDRVAVKSGENALTYGELNRYANLAAHIITSQYQAPGLQEEEQTVGLLFNNGIEAVVGLLAVLKAGKIYVPLGPGFPVKRLAGMVDYFDIRMMVTDSRNEPLAETLAARAKKEMIVLNIESIDESVSCRDLGARVPGSRDPIAYIIHTSGTTGSPKGVVQSCKNLRFFADSYSSALSISADDRLTFLSSFSFDGAVEDIFPALLSGAALYPFNINEEPISSIAGWLIKEQITIYHSVPTVFRYFVSALSGREQFPCLRVICMGAETLRSHDLHMMGKYFPGTLFAHMYGQTESSVNTMEFLDTREPNQKIMIGKPLPGIQLYLFNQEGEEVETHEIGEIVVASDHIARGYWKNPEETAKQFLYDEELGRLYRTGDLGRMDFDGKIEFLGRRDKQVKIRGFRIEPAEIESCLSTMESLKHALVIDREDEAGERYLCAYIVPQGEVDITRLGMKLSETLPEYMVPRYIVPLDKIPLLANGKPDRNALLVPGSHGTGTGRKKYTAPGNERENKLVKIWGEVLGLEKEIISIDANFFQLGGHSLKATLLAAKIHKEFNVNLPLAKVFKAATIRELSKEINKTSREKYLSLETVEKKDFYPLSWAQKRLYVLQQLDPGSKVYNMSMVLSLQGDVDEKSLEKAFKGLISRHESLRTSFSTVKDEPVQRVHDEVKFEIEYYNSGRQGDREIGKLLEDSGRQGDRETGKLLEDSGRQANREIGNELIKSFIRPFDLSRAPLLRVGLIKIPVKQYILMIDMHHIITDGISQAILTNEFVSLYAGKELPGLRLRYKDYSQWQQDQVVKHAFRQQEEYWLQEFREEMPILNLPVDYPRPALRSFAGSVIDFELSREETKALNEIARKHEATLFMVLLVLYNIFLSKISGQEDIVVGTPLAGRRHADLERIIGMFVNTLALRHYPCAEKTFTAFLGEVKEKTLRAFENQDYPFENLVENAVKERDTSRNPLFDVVLVLQNLQTPQEKIPGADMEILKVKPYAIEKNTAKFDLTLTTIEKEEKLHFSFEYCTHLFREETVIRFIQYFKKIVSWVLEKPGETISRIEILPGEEKNRLLYDLNDTGAEYPQDKTLHQLFAEQVERTPGHTALVGIQQTHEKNYNMSYMSYMSYISYTELNKKSHQLANILKEKGVRADTIVGVMMEPSVEMIIGLLAILKAGGAYMPIDPGYPEDRLNYMLADSKARVLLAAPGVQVKAKQVKVKAEVEERFIDIIDISNLLSPSTSLSSPSTLTCQVGPADLAYIIYTSGTTGKPKGTLIGHRNVVRLMLNDKFPFDFSCNDIWTLFHSCCFDFSVWEMYGALLYGGQLVTIPRLIARDTRKYLGILKKKQVTVLNQTPSAFYHLMNLELENPGQELNLRYVIFGGEALAPARLKRWQAKYPGSKLINMYGITETTVHVTFKEITGREIESAVSNIGKPIPTLSTYIMDKNLKLLPSGAAGELFVGGEGVARGYLNRPDLTNEKFIENPYKPGERLYRSGDLVKLSPQGELEYSGRIDHQVKIRGFRIEPAEIERRLLGHPTIKDTVIIPGEKENKDKYLCAYIVSHSEITVSALREYLSMELPDYMIPSYFIPLERIPLTSSGKLDRKSLPEPGQSRPFLETAYAVPKNNLQRIIVNIWQEVLNLDKVGIHDNFFDLGGNSLDVIKVNSKLKIGLGKDVPLLEMFQYPTIHSFSTYLHREKQDEPAPLDHHKQITETVALMEETMQMLLGDEDG